MRASTFFVFTSILLFASCDTGQEGKHLFILSGQSNMARLNPEDSFTPAVVREFGDENVVVVKDAKSGQPIRRWHQSWQPPDGMDVQGHADLYDSLMNKVQMAVGDDQLATVTFIWMQGERDAREQLGEVYEASLVGLYQQLCRDLRRHDINFVIGRLSDFDMQNERYLHWTMVRDIQVQVAESNTRFTWIDTDDLNDGLNARGEEIENDLHMSEEGYSLMGTRFAEKAIQLITNTN